MADNRIIVFIPDTQHRLDPVAGLRTWFNKSGKIEYGGINTLKRSSETSYIVRDTFRYEKIEPNDISKLQSLADEYNLQMILSVKWFTLGIDFSSLHLNTSPIALWSFEPLMWGQIGKGGLEEADDGLLAFARALGAAYVLSTKGLGYDVTRDKFVRDGSSYRFNLPPLDPRNGHKIEWIDVCSDLGGTIPSGFVEAERITKTHGYIRYVLAGTEAEVW